MTVSEMAKLGGLSGGKSKSSKKIEAARKNLERARQKRWKKNNEEVKNE